MDRPKEEHHWNQDMKEEHDKEEHQWNQRVAKGVTETMDTRISGSINHQTNTKLEDLQLEESDIKGQAQWLQSRCKKRKRAIGMTNKAHPFASYDKFRAEIKQLIEEMQRHLRKKPLVLSTEFVGIAFEENLKQVWELLADDQVFIIGIYGMGGVGKTLLVSYVENEIKRKGTFEDVFWVTVSHNCSITKLQHVIAKRMGVKLEEDDERIRAANLSSALERKQKSVLILDDVWKYIDLQKVGIPLKVNGIKVILTTRLKHVCQQMDCLPNNMIRMLPLSPDEAWELFELKLGYNGNPAKLPLEVLEIARSIVERCAGLPLGINLMARTMRGLDDIHRWIHAWNKLEKLEMGEEVEEEVFKVLKRSYDNLMERDMQNCFLYCALLFDFETDELIMKLVDNGLLNGRSLEEIFDEGHTILDKLEDNSLLWTGLFSVMHRLVTDMACHILKESQRFVMVKFKTKIAHMQEWTADLELVNLMHCDIEEIPEGTSPYCPGLSTLIITKELISHIPECFFIHMNVLAILDLSFNERLESLPNSLSNLRSLISLVLKGCRSLKYVPPLGELQALSRLVISGCSIEQVPQGLEMLINLKWLDLSNNDNLTLVPAYVLTNLTNMQYLDLRGAMVAVEDVQGMSTLECFGGSFPDCKTYNYYVRKILNTGFAPKTYHLLLGNICSIEYWEDVGTYIFVPDNPRRVSFGDCEDSPHILPTELTNLSIYDNNQWICLCNALVSEAASSLWRVKIFNCTQLKSLFCLSGSCSLCTKIQSLQCLSLENLENLTVVCKEDAADVRQSLSSGGMFSHLKHFYISTCHEIEKLLTPGLVLQLRNLETITVNSCDSMKEIFAAGNESDDDGSSIILPKLIRLELVGLPQLKTVCKGIIFCESSLTPDIRDCPNLEGRPTIHTFP